MTPARSQAHAPVMVDQVLAAVAPQPGDTIVDATFGAGGYTRAFLAAADCRVVAIDRDPTALAAAGPLTETFGDRLILIEGRFSAMDRDLTARGLAPVDAVALDIGVSSMQLDQAERGFSFQHDGPLDMRMSQAGAHAGETAADVVNSYDEAALADIIYQYGEEPKSRRIAKAIAAARADAPVDRTAQLAEIVARAVGGRRGKKTHPATATFQALRIHVNAELVELDRGLMAAERVLRPEGRLAVVSFHSLEDRRVKTFLAERSGNTPSVSRHQPLPAAAADGPAPTFRLPKKGARKPDQSEIDINPRARSARLRTAVRTAAPAWAGGKEAL